MILRRDCYNRSSRISPLFIFPEKEERLLKNIPSEYFDELSGKSPQYLLELIRKIIAVFLYRLNVPRNEVEQFTDQIKGGEFQMLFDSFEAYDVQETRRVSKAEGKAEDTLELLSDPGTVPEELRRTIMETTDLEKLKIWLRLAVKADDLEQFREKDGI